MKRRLLIFMFGSLFACLSLSVDAQDFSLHLEAERACGGVFTGAVGSTVRVNFTAYLVASVPGVTGYGIAVGAEGPGVSVGFDPCDSTCSAKILFPDGDGDEVFFNSPFKVDPNRVPSSGPLAGSAQGPGFVDGVAVSPFSIPAPVLPAGRTNLFRFYVDVQVPGEETGAEIVVLFKDGLQGPGEPIQNGVTFENLTELPELASCSFTVQPTPAIVDLDIVGDSRISTPPLVPGRGVVFVTIDSKIDQREGVAGWQFSISHSDNIRITAAAPAADLFDLVPDLDGAVGFDATQSTPVVAHDLVYFDGDPPDPACELVSGEPQGPGLISGVVLAQPPTPDRDQFLPGDSGGPVRVMRIEFEQVEPFPTEGRNEEIATFEWTNCLRGDGQPVKTGVTVRGDTLLPRQRRGHEVLFVRVDKSRFQRGDANDDGQIGDLSDAVFIIKYLFPTLDASPNVSLLCTDAADSNDDERINIADSIHLFNALFYAGAKIVPFADCGDDDDSTSRSCPPGSVTSCEP